MSSFPEGRTPSTAAVSVLDPAAKLPRIAVAQVYVDPAHLWLRCPHCQVLLDGFIKDPRGLQNISCDDCGGCFDIPRRANLVIT